MLSIGKLARGAEGYYLRAVAGGVEDYYLGSRCYRRAGYLDHGKALTIHQAEGRAVDRGSFSARRPSTGGRLRRMSRGRHRYDLHTGADRADPLAPDCGPPCRTPGRRRIGSSNGRCCVHAPSTPHTTSVAEKPAELSSRPAARSGSRALSAPMAGVTTTADREKGGGRRAPASR